MSGSGSGRVRKYNSGAQKRKKITSILASVEGVSKLTTFFARNLEGIWSTFQLPILITIVVVFFCRSKQFSKKNCTVMVIF
jgi:ABC-type transport system involved in cytochrome bd biosynthesis fused ATPase/permease subunit